MTQQGRHRRRPCEFLTDMVSWAFLTDVVQASLGDFLADGTSLRDFLADGTSLRDFLADGASLGNFLADGTSLGNFLADGTSLRDFVADGASLGDLSSRRDGQHDGKRQYGAHQEIGKFFHDSLRC